MHYNPKRVPRASISKDGPLFLGPPTPHASQPSFVGPAYVVALQTMAPPTSWLCIQFRSGRQPGSPAVPSFPIIDIGGFSGYIMGEFFLITQGGPTVWLNSAPATKAVMTTLSRSLSWKSSTSRSFYRQAARHQGRAGHGQDAACPQHLPGTGQGAAHLEYQVDH